MIGRRSGTCLLTATLCRPKLWFHHESDDLPDTSTVGTEAPCPRQSFALEGASVPETTPPPSVSSPLATARVPTARVSITARELTTNRSVVVPSDWGGGSARGAAPSSLRASPDSTTGSNLKTSSGGNPLQAATASSTRELATSGVTLVTVSSTILVAAVAATTSRVDNDDGNPPPTVRWWFPAIEEVRQHEEQRLVRFERRQVGYRGNGQYQQFGRAHHQQCAVLLGDEEVKNMTNAENFTKYDEAAFRAAISADPEFCYCMSTTCKSGQCHPAGIDEPTFCCGECGHNHCVSCEAFNWHEGLTCAQYQHSLQRAQEDEESQQEVGKSSTIGTSSLCRALLGQHDRGTSFAIEEERQHDPSGGTASPGNDTSTGFLPLSPSSNINQFTSFGGFGGGGAVAQIKNDHFPAENYTTAGMNMSVWSNISSSVEPTTSSSTKAHIASSTR
ncbi:hypothetical protein D6D06_08953 [Aureobasidium pullulans]|nr:hypothetical protein D6D06_08953 [Aureobasidium pullulans]